MATLSILDTGRSGIIITYYPKGRRLEISGYYDSMVSMGRESMSLSEFFKMLGITEEACKEVFKGGKDA